MSGYLPVHTCILTNGWLSNALCAACNPLPSPTYGVVVLDPSLRQYDHPPQTTTPLFDADIERIAAAVALKLRAHFGRVDRADAASCLAGTAHHEDAALRAADSPLRRFRRVDDVLAVRWYPGVPVDDIRTFEGGCEVRTRKDAAQMCLAGEWIVAFADDHREVWTDDAFRKRFGEVCGDSR